MEAFIVGMVSVGATLVATLIQKKFTDVDLVKTLRGDIKKINKEMKESKEDAKKLNELMNKSFEIQKKMMGQTMKPTMISSVAVLGAFYFLSTFYSETTLLLPFSLPFIGNTLGWIGIYILVSIISSIVFRKIFDLGF